VGSGAEGDRNRDSYRAKRKSPAAALCVTLA